MGGGGREVTRPRPRHAEGGQGAPGRRDRLGQRLEGEVDLNLPTLVDLGCAAVATARPGTVGYSDKIGATNTHRLSPRQTQIYRKLDNNVS